MKCEDFKDNIESLTEDDTCTEMVEHMAQCEECREYYSVIGLLTPTRLHKAPGSIREHVLRKAARRETIKHFFCMKNKFLQVAASLTGVVLITAVLVLNFTPTRAQAAENQLDKSIQATSGVKSMIMKIDVRTLPKENFDYIDPRADMVEHTLTVEMEKPMKWRLEKKGRCVVFDGTDKWLWIEDMMIYKGTRETNFEEWFKVLLRPEMLLVKEKLALQEKNVGYNIEKTRDDIILRADVKAQGDFANDYLLYSSIGESDTRRELVFDRETQLLKSVKIYIRARGKHRLVVNIRDIHYNVPIDPKQLTRMESKYPVRDIDAVVVTSGQFAHVTAEIAAQLIADAINSNELESVEEAFINYNFAKIRAFFAGKKVVKVGKPFKSGQYAGVFIPYSVKQPDGKIKKITLALRKDTPNREWIVDGGI